jgi:hypothetical protein
VWFNVIKGSNPRRRDTTKYGFIDYFSSLEDAIQIAKKRAKGSKFNKNRTPQKYAMPFLIGKVRTKGKESKVMYYLSDYTVTNFTDRPKDLEFEMSLFSVDVFGFVFDNKVNNYTKVAEEHMTPAEIEDFKTDKLHTVINPSFRDFF